MVFVLEIEGNIGIGKSTLLNKLKAHFASDDSVVFVDEPVSTWEENGLLAAMYEDRISRCSFQLMALTTRYGPLLMALKSGASTVITERSIFSDRACFAKVNLADAADQAAYAVSHDALTAALPSNVRRATVMLEAPRTILNQRIANRGRAAEQQATEEDGEPAPGGIPDEYLALLDDAHASYFEACDPAARARVDATASPDEVCAAVLAAFQAFMPDGGVNKENEPPEPASPASPVAVSPTSVLCSSSFRARDESPPAAKQVEKGAPMGSVPLS